MNKVVKNASWIIVCRVVQAVLGLIISMITVRYLGPSNYGLLSYAASVVTFFLPVMKLGITSVLVQSLVSEPEKEEEILGTSLVLSLLSALACIAGVNIFVNLVNGAESDTILVCALYSSILLFQAFEVFNYWFQARLMAKYSSIIALAAYGIVSAFKVYLLASQKNIYWFSVVNTFDFFLIAVGLVFAYHHAGGSRLAYSNDRAGIILSISKYYIISDLMIVVFAQTDRIMLKAMIGNTATGFYSAAVTCAGMTQFVFAAIIDSMRPIIFAERKKSQESYQLNLIRLFSIIIFLSLIQSVIFTLFAPFVIHVVCGKQYMEAVSPLRIVVWYTTFSYLGSARNIWILAEGKQKYLWQINLIGALTNVFLNALLIPVLGVNGAAVASLITQFTTNVVTGFIFSPIRGVNSILGQAIKPEIFIGIIKSMLNRVMLKDVQDI